MFISILSKLSVIGYQYIIYAEEPVHCICHAVQVWLESYTELSEVSSALCVPKYDGVMTPFLPAHIFCRSHLRWHPTTTLHETVACEGPGCSGL